MKQRTTYVDCRKYQNEKSTRMSKLRKASVHDSQEFYLLWIFALKFHFPLTMKNYQSITSYYSYYEKLSKYSVTHYCFYYEKLKVTNYLLQLLVWKLFE